MSIHRIKKERDFVVLDNAMLRDPKLSLKAKGLLAFVLTRPDNWVFTVQGLSRFCRDGPDAVRSAVQELEKAGYVVRQRKRKNGKYREMEYDIYEKPIQVLPTQVEPKQDTTSQEKGTLPNTDLPNIELLSTDHTNNPSTNPREMERLIRKQIEYDIMCQRYDRRQLDNLVAIMTEAMVCTENMIDISKSKGYATGFVQQCLRRIGPLHIEQIMEYLIANRPEIRNVRGYLLTALINVANTLDMGYEYGEQFTI